MNAKTIVNSFGFQVEEEPVSIYPFSPVYQLERPEGEFIVKKTQTPIAKANRLMNYTKEHVFLDEVMWLMADVKEDWKNPAQRKLFGGLMDLLMEVGATKKLYSRSIK